MTSYTLPGYYSTKDAQRIKDRMNGKTYMNFKVEFGGVAGNNEIIVMTDREDTTETELQEMFVSYALTNIA